jgi:multidrug resistance protein
MNTDTGINRRMITVSIMLATIIQALDGTIANVALPHMQGSLSASQDQITWVLTSFIVAAAIATPLTGWLCDRFGQKNVFLASVAGFTIASVLCGLSGSLGQIVVARLLQGVFGAALVPLSQATLLDINPREKHGSAMAVWGMGVMIGPILGPTLGGWLTDSYNWRWVVLHQCAGGGTGLLRHLALHPPGGRAAQDALRCLRFRHPQPRHRRAADAAGPGRTERLVRVHRNLGGSRAAGDQLRMVRGPYAHFAAR